MIPLKKAKKLDNETNIINSNVDVPSNEHTTTNTTTSFNKFMDEELIENKTLLPKDRDPENPLNSTSIDKTTTENDPLRSLAVMVPIEDNYNSTIVTNQTLSDNQSFKF